jgi:hypothetical protein
LRFESGLNLQSESDRTDLWNRISGAGRSIVPRLPSAPGQKRLRDRLPLRVGMVSLDGAAMLLSSVGREIQGCSKNSL